jgi:hypothetical protein
VYFGHDHRGRHVRGTASETFPERPVYGTMLAAVWIAATMSEFALRGFPPFLFRGCTAAGRASIHGDFLIARQLSRLRSFTNSPMVRFSGWLRRPALNDAYGIRLWIESSRPS